MQGTLGSNHDVGSKKVLLATHVLVAGKQYELTQDKLWSCDTLVEPDVRQHLYKAAFADARRALVMRFCSHALCTNHKHSGLMSARWQAR